MGNHLGEHYTGYEGGYEDFRQWLMWAVFLLARTVEYMYSLFWLNWFIRGTQAYSFQPPQFATHLASFVRPIVQAAELCL